MTTSMLFSCNYNGLLSSYASGHESNPSSGTLRTARKVSSWDDTSRLVHCRLSTKLSCNRRERVRKLQLCSVTYASTSCNVHCQSSFVSGVPVPLSSAVRYVRNKRMRCRAAYVSPPAATDKWLDDGDSEDDIKALREQGGSLSDEEYFIGRKSVSADIVTWKLIAGLILKDKMRIAVAVLALVGGTSCTLIMPQFSGKFFETLIGRRQGPLGRLLTTLAAIYCLEPLCTIAYVTSLYTTWERVMADLRSHVFRRLLVQKVEFYDRFNVAELTSILSTELGSIEKIVNENVSRDRGFRALSEVLGTLTILWYLSKELAPAFAILMLSVSAGVAVYKRTTAPVFKAHALAQARIIEKANESFSSIRTVRSFGGERRQLAGFSKQVEASRVSGTRLGWLKSLNESWTRIAVYFSLLVVYFLGGSRVKSGQLPVGTMVAFIGYTFTLTFAVQGLVNTLADLRSVLAAVARINTLATSAPADAYLEVGLEREERGEIDSCKDEIQKLGGIEAVANGTVTAGGANGSAASLSKRASSSVCELAWSGDLTLDGRDPEAATWHRHGAGGRQWGGEEHGCAAHPSEGRILLADRDVREFDKSEWARAVSLVNQEPVLFQMSIRDNIAYGLPNDDVTEDEILEAAKAANAHEFVLGLPQGYDTLVGERGSLLSGGQRQRVAIARALLKNSPILILDEATSALDSVSERLVQDALQRLMKGRTTLVIAHRLSTVQSANQIAVMSAGEIIELGSHTELVNKGGAYAELVNSQRLSFE
eukprot:jgi/Mesen1/4572/ME000232S03827